MLKNIIKINLFKYKLYSTVTKTSLSEPLNISTSDNVNDLIPIPASDNESKQYSLKIIDLVKEISSLNLLEVADLNALLKKTLNIQDIASSFNPLSIAAMNAQNMQSNSNDKEAQSSTKTAFTVKMTKYDETKKVGIIKEIKNLMTGMNLVQAKKYVESLPQTVKSDLGKDEAEKLKEQLTALGATIVIE
ncbi:unnamed protein product [Gordionus sp. m RMFG-2023]|uniref:large ribosomal subunit protein bL12m-like n=1 Tax=Gordionus sp. m RMFG-2023 TaxID=3053472 RepID=UPI0030E49EC5